MALTPGLVSDCGYSKHHDSFLLVSLKSPPKLTEDEEILYLVGDAMKKLSLVERGLQVPAGIAMYISVRLHCGRNDVKRREALFT